MELLDIAIEEAIPRLEELARTPNAGEWSSPEPEGYDYFVPAPNTGNSVALRLDWELADSSPKEDIARVMLSVAEYDLADLLENGDTASSNPLHKAMDGAKKLGKEPVDVRIHGLHLFEIPCPRKKTTEYKLFIRLYVEWA